MKRLMILGAGIYQVPLIKQAKEMGVYTIVVSVPGNYPGFAYADKVCYEDTVDYNGILALAKEEQIDGIVTAGTDVAVVTVGKVCDELNLCGLSFESAKVATDKMLMKTKYEEHDVRTAKFRRVYFTDENKKETIADLTYPLIAKAVDTSGSRGIVKVNSHEEFIEAIDTVQENTKKDYFIVEEFLEGEEFGAQAFVHRGKVSFILPHGDYVFKGDTGVPIGHWAPYELDSEVIEDAKVQLQKAIEAMGLDNCAINADFILVNGKTYVLEIGGRSGATCLAELVSLYYGYNYYEKIIRASLGEALDFSCISSAPNACMLLMSDKDGVMKEIINENEENEDIVEVQYDYQIGDAVTKFKVGPHRIGHVITKGKTIEEAIALLHKVLDRIHIVVE